MTINDIGDVMRRQREYFASGATLPVKARVDALKRLYAAISAHENEICHALHADLGKSATESYMSEIGMVLVELRHMIKHLPSYAKDQRVSTPMSQFASRCYRKATPYGSVLVMSPWNYPFLLTVDPVVDAVAAGNTVVVKPSAYSPATSAVIEKLLSEQFPTEHVAVVTGGRKENAALLDTKFDFVFFTGSQAVGKEVLRHTAETLTPAVLELGGKSPCIVDDTTPIPLAARRIVFGKFLNCGQTCVAPDHILCDVRVRDKLVEELKKQIVLQLGEHPLENPEYGKIINEKHFRRLLGLIDKNKVAWGGGSDEKTLKIEPTVMTDVDWSDAVMGEEIFGPILPVLTYERFDDVFRIMADKPKPLALYLFSDDKARIRAVTERISYGGGCINDTVIHLACSDLPFGGVGESGMGAYHGRVGFDTFTHYKSILHKKNFVDMKVRYRPYTSKRAIKMLRFFMK